MNREEMIKLARYCNLGLLVGPLYALLDDEWERLHRFAAREHRDRRERIATAAMQGLLAHYGETGRYYNNAADCSAAAVAYADALIAELDKEVKP